MEKLLPDIRSDIEFKALLPAHLDLPLPWPADEDGAFGWLCTLFPVLLVVG